jgi:hypothetical protein
MTTQEVYVPTFEVALCDRNHKGEVIDGKMTEYSATTGQGLAACVFKHNKKFPRPRKKKKADTTQ